MVFEDLMRDFSRGPSGRFFNGERFTFYFSSSTNHEEVLKQRLEQEAVEAAWRRKMVDEIRRRKEAEETRAKAQEMARAANEMEEALAKERRERAEKARQEALWAQENATTQSAKQDLCFHSALWVKEKSQKKFKCTSCGQKRGMVGHRCAHCSLLVCQVCLNDIRKSL
jgi:hypothetical protein